jgi:hypothetical protein
MPQSKIYFIHSYRGVTRFIDRIVNSKHIDSWLFIGRDALLSYKLETSVLSNVSKINISQLMSESQYEHSDEYIEYIDSQEKIMGKLDWWSSTLSCKNPWVSNFFLRFCQLDVLNKIIQNPELYGNNILVVVEETAVLNAIKENFQSDNLIHYICHWCKSLLAVKYYLKGFIWRTTLIFAGVWEKRALNRIFHSNYFDYDRNKHEHLAIIPTFIDHRSFRSGSYVDPFMGKVFDNKLVSARKIIIIPIIISASNKQLKYFSDWLSLNGYYIHPLHRSFSFYKALVYSIQSMFDRPRKMFGQNMNNYSVSELLYQERMEEWSSMNMNGHLLKRFAQCFYSNNNILQLIYPFENQQWERILINELRCNNQLNAIGIQNAPCPKLSTRYFVAKDCLEDMPLPDHIISNGDVSFQALAANYKNVAQVLQAYTSRPPHISLGSDEKVSPTRYIMVACSIGQKESVELVIFVIDALKECSMNLFVNIVPHPLVQYNYSSLMRELNTPAHIQLSQLTYSQEMERSEFIIFDSSTAGLEGMSNGITPIFIGHECSIHVNPNEFDQNITKTVYNSESLLQAIEFETKNIDTYKDVSMQYYGSNDKANLNKSLDELIPKIEIGL